MGYPGGDGWVRWLGVGEIRRGGRLRQLSWRVLVVVTGSGQREVLGRARWELGGGGGRVEWLGWGGSSGGVHTTILRHVGDRVGEEMRSGHLLPVRHTPRGQAEVYGGRDRVPQVPEGLSPRRQLHVRARVVLQCRRHWLHLHHHLMV